MFSSNTYIKRRKALMENLQSGLILFPGNSNVGMNYKDNVYHFRQDSNFLYFFGIDQEDLAAVIDLDDKTSTIYGDELSVEYVVWMGPQKTIKEKAKASGIENTLPYAEIEKKISKAVSQGRKIHFLPPYRSTNILKLSAWLNKSVKEIEKGYSLELIQAVIDQRSYKSMEEIDQMEQALATSKEMHEVAMKNAKEGIKESDLTGMVEWKATAGGGGLAYPIILTVNGQTLHNHYHGNTLKKGQMVLGDFGAETEMHYAGDITRTFPVDKKFTQKQKDIYSIVLKAEKDCIQALKPGVLYKDLHLKAARIILEGVSALGLVKGNLDDALEQGAYGLFFPHGLGHMIGLDVHDMEDLGENHVGYGPGLERSTQFGLKSLRLARKLEEGFVLTVEPGIYFIPELIQKWKEEKMYPEYINYDKLTEYLAFGGIRIEDNCLITKEGQRTLGPYIPKEIEEIENIRD